MQCSKLLKLKYELNLVKLDNRSCVAAGINLIRFSMVSRNTQPNKTFGKLKEKNYIANFGHMQKMVKYKYM